MERINGMQSGQVQESEWEGEEEMNRFKRWWNRNIAVAPLSHAMLDVGQCASEGLADGIKSKNEIEIIMSNPNKPPKVILNGQVIKGIIELRYNYDTDTEEPNGQHNFTVKYCDEDTNLIRTVSVNKIWEGEDE